MSINARAAVVAEKDAPFQVREIELDEPRDDEVLVKMRAVGVCHTDIIMQEQFFPVNFPAVFGHEGAGVVETVGKNVTKVAPGDHVVLTFASCGSCQNCLRGLSAYCLDLYAWNFGGTRADGTSAVHADGKEISGHFFGQSSFADRAICYQRNVVKIGDDVPLELFGPMGCGIQTGAGAVLNSLSVGAGSSIAVFGTGGVGLSAVMAARVAGATTIIGVDTKPARLDLAREMGATHTVDASSEDVAARIADITGPGAHFSLETTGSPNVLPLAVDCLRATGTCGAIGASPMGTTAAVVMNSLIFGRSIRGIAQGDSVPDIFIPTLVELYRQGRFPFDQMITTYPFGDINKACEDASSGRTIKPVLLFE